jgi:hypothetical protein
MKHKDAYGYLKTADIVILIDKSKVKDNKLGEDIVCKYFLSSCENQLRDSKNKYEISYYILCNNKHKFRFYNLGQIVEPYSVDLYQDIKNYIETNKNMLSYKIQLAVDDLDVTIYFNKNKCKMQIDLCSSTWGCIDNIKHFYYDIMLCNKDKDNLKFFTFWSLHISEILDIIKNLNCDKETKNDYYIKLIKVMNTENKFQALLSDVKDFEDKMLLLDIYQQYGGTI